LIQEKVKSSDRGVDFSFTESKNSLKMLVVQLLRVLIYNYDHSISILILPQTIQILINIQSELIGNFDAHLLIY